MLFTDIVPKFIRFPWKVFSGKEHFRDAEVAASVAFDCGGMEFFKQEPSDDELSSILHAIAPPIIMSLVHGKGESLQKRNKWPALSVEEQSCVLGTLNLVPAKHSSILMLAVDNEWRFRMASYIAAAYAFTTYTKPYVLTYDKLVQLAFNSLNGDSFEMTEARRAGLLILIGTGGPIAGAERVYGFLSSILSKRMSQGKIHIFIDSPEGSVLVNMMKKTRVQKDDVIKMYQDIFPQSLRVHNLFFGPSVYIDPIDRLESVQDERRKTIVI
jgi:hypothetical protein